MAFASGDSNILTTEVDNSSTTTNNYYNQYVCDNTQDKVFLLSCRDYINSNYGFSSNSSRECLTTDWSRARGAFYISFNGLYCGRSPFSGSYEQMTAVMADGGTGSGAVFDDRLGVRPALTIIIE